MSTSEPTPGASVLVTRLARLVYRRSPEAVLGMSLKGFAILGHLREVDSTSQQALGDMLCVDANTLVLLLNELEAAGHAMRERDPSDRRRHIVQLTPAGRVALRKAEHGMESVEDEVFAALSVEERATLRGLLAKTLEDTPAVVESTTRPDGALTSTAAHA
jgi:DNA-binding MarR family transcriptional regulator